MSLASSREKRSTAGNRYSKILTEAEEDEFFKTTYGGFEEEDNDCDYKEEKEVEDVTDSDISIDENDEVVSDNDEEMPKKRKKLGLITKAYKEPRPSGVNNIPAESKDAIKKKDATAAAIERKKRIARLERKSIRRSTAAKSAATQERVKSRIETEKKRKMRRLPRFETRLTQEQLLKEAKITEEENLKSLEKFQKMEVEKKKMRFVRKVAVGPMVRYHSTAMPVIGSVTESKCERTFVTFEDSKQFRRIFNKTKPYVKTLYCPVTRARAKYIDPITSVPYSNKQVFHIIRETYNELLEAKGDRSNAEVNQWLDYWMEVRMERAVSAALEQGNIFD